jgi:hypothetical protein
LLQGCWRQIRLPVVTRLSDVSAERCAAAAAAAAGSGSTTPVIISTSVAVIASVVPTTNGDPWHCRHNLGHLVKSCEADLEEYKRVERWHHRSGHLTWPPLRCTTVLTVAVVVVVVIVVAAAAATVTSGSPLRRPSHPLGRKQLQVPATRVVPRLV